MAWNSGMTMEFLAICGLSIKVGKSAGFLLKKKISTAPLQPRQKVIILTEHAVPRHEYDLVIRYLDGIIRSYVKQWYHLPVSVSKHFLYSRTCDGGCGLTWLAESIHGSLKPSCPKLLRCPYRTGVTVATLDGDGFTYASGSALLRRREESTATGIPLSTNGSGGRSFLSKREFLCALKLRSNTLPTKETLRALEPWTYSVEGVAGRWRPLVTFQERVHPFFLNELHVTTDCVQVSSRLPPPLDWVSLWSLAELDTAQT